MLKLLVGLTLLSAPFFEAYANPGLSLEVAKKIAGGANKVATQKGWAVSIAIVNLEGNLMYFERNDGAYVGSVDAAIAKAKSSNAFARPTSAFVEALKAGRTGILSLPGVIAIEGGVPLVEQGKFIGAIGVSGAKSTEDEEAAKAGAALIETKK